MNINSEDPVLYAARRDQDQDHIIEAALAVIKSRLTETGFSATSPDAVKQYLSLTLANEPIEKFVALLLNNQHQLLRFEVLSTGTIDGASVHPREVLKVVLEHNAKAVIFAHNHPSGICQPSSADKAITRTLKNALSLIDVNVLDHIIVAGMDHYSFAESGAL